MKNGEIGERHAAMIALHALQAPLRAQRRGHFQYFERPRAATPGKPFHLKLA